MNQQIITNRPATREGWLVVACKELADDFSQIGVTLPEETRVSVGFPKGVRGKGKAIGQCFSSGLCTDGIGAIFISPELADPVEALGVLVHELVHASDDCKSGHKGYFKRTATKIGLEGKMTSTTIGENLRTRLVQLADLLGPYPHAALNPGGKTKPGSRLLKAVCPECDYTVRVTAKWVAVGLPICPTCDLEFVAG